MAKLCKKLFQKIIGRDDDSCDSESDIECGSRADHRPREDSHYEDIVSSKLDAKENPWIIDANEDGYYTQQEIRENAEKYKGEVLHRMNEITQYQFGEIIGKGCFGQVYRGFDLDTGCIMAIKQVPVLKFINKSK